ncbi:probable cytochrome P450 316a1 [Drosophila innubila]|uniref:probable cytochrome P450 316a1 n=1 Tax=Drosophila innubila TaxID=198719 RepID=UPI00148E6EA2|nr:probable cytochrome P450 316a1 [Drosophila innubila]
MISAGIFVCLCLVSAFNYFRTRRQRKFIANLKGPFTFPLVGSVYKIVFLTPRNFFQSSAKYLSKYGTLSRCWLFHRLFIPVADLELAKQLLHSESHLETGYDLMRDWLADSVLMCPSDQWPLRHQRLAAFFQKDKMLQLIKLLQEQAEKPYPELVAQAETRQVFNVWPIVSAKVLDFILATTCGVHSSEQYKKAFADLTKLYRNRFLSIKSANRLIFWLSSPFTRRRQLKLIKRINEENKRILEECRQQKVERIQVKNEGINIERIEPTERLDHQSLIDVLNGSENLSDDQLLAELNTCNFLGYLLCSTTLCFALILIARHPSVQQRCLEELRIAHSEKEENLQGMSYLDAVLKETLRLHPPQLIVGRELSKDFPYTHSKVGDAALPAGSEVYINLYEMQRSEEYGQNAKQFQPERFLGNSPELLSFGMGPRSCPAQQFSLMLLKSLLAPLLLKFELLPHGDAVRQNLQLSPGSRNGFQLAVKLR